MNIVNEYYSNQQQITSETTWIAAQALLDLLEQFNDPIERMVNAYDEVLTNIRVCSTSRNPCFKSNRFIGSGLLPPGNVSYYG
jgi:hypothetical protein